MHKNVRELESSRTCSSYVGDTPTFNMNKDLIRVIGVKRIMFWNLHISI